MAVYAYKGIDARGKSVKGIRDADSAKARTHCAQAGWNPRDRHPRAVRGGEESIARHRFQAALPTGFTDGRGRRHSPALRAAPFRRPLGRSPERVDRAARPARAEDGVHRHPQSGQRGQHAGGRAQSTPQDLPHPLRQHGGGRRGVGHARRGARTAGRVLGRPDQASEQGSWAPSPTRSSWRWSWSSSSF